MMTEKEYVKKTSLEHRKKYAQFFTPVQISDFMASWVLDGKEGYQSILEPAIGLGVFSRSMLKINHDIRVVGYDIDESIFNYATGNFANSRLNVTINLENYLTSSWSDKYDGIICNPPYLKFHDYDNAKFVPLVNNKLKTHLNGFTNIYTLFLLKSIYQLKDGGRMAYIIPSEFLNSDYGVEVKRALLQSGVLKHIIIVDFTQCAFDDALTTACILLCHKDKRTDCVTFSNIQDVANLSTCFADNTAYNYRELNPEVKWKRYYEETNSSKYNHLIPFSTFAKVSRGIATGANNYFTFKASKIDEYNLPEECFRRCICHSTDVRNQVLTEDDFDEIANEDKTVYLFNGCSDDNNAQVRSYINLGEANGINEKYLTASRNPWYALENREPSPIWVSVFNRNGLRFVRNKANVYNLTTFHCVYNISEIDTDILFAYLVTDLAKEIFLDNSRQYGNGLVKFEPNDLNKGNVVDLRLLTEEEKDFTRRASEKLQYCESVNNQIIRLLDDFFRDRYSSNHVDLPHYVSVLQAIAAIKQSATDKKKITAASKCKQLNIFNL